MIGLGGEDQPYEPVCQVRSLSRFADEGFVYSFY
jgi:hypothetical protein